jgi:phosphate transport system permease protein
MSTSTLHSPAAESGIIQQKLITAERIFKALCFISLALPLLLLLVLIASTVVDGSPRLDWTFLTNYPSRIAARAGLLPALVGTILLMLLTALLAVPIGVGAAIYLEEYARPSKLTSFIELNISNLAGVPSIIYGLLGLGLFVRTLGFGRSLMAGAATLALLLLPMVVIASREALRTVPHSMREACYALGGDKWRSIRQVVLPMSLPGILTGIILSVARAVGETAPLITIGALTFVPFLPTSLWMEFTAIPIQVYNWISRPQAEFHVNAAAGVAVLLTVMLALNAVAIWLRIRLGRRNQW